MGFDRLYESLQQVRKKKTNAGIFLTTADILCLDEFLRLLSANKTALAQFKTMIQGLIITASEAVVALNLVIAQLETALSIGNAFLQTFRSAKTAAIKSLIPFPFTNDAYLHCKPVQEIKEMITKAIPKPNPESVLPGNAKRYAKKYKQATQSFKELEWRLYGYQKQINDIRKTIEKLQAQILGWQAIVDAIGQQFGV